MLLRPDVSLCEFWIYFVIWSLCGLYSIYCFANSTNKRFENYDDDYSDFELGWSFLPKRKDAGDFEWKMVKFLINRQSWWIVLSAVVSEAIRHLNYIQILPVWQIVLSTTFIFTEFGLLAFGMIILQPLIFSLVLHTRSRFITWFVNILTLLLLLLYKMFGLDDFFTTYKWTFHTVYLMMATLYWMNLRCASYCLDMIDANQKQQNLKFLSYCLYLPHLISGPFIQYKDFLHCHQHSNNVGNRLFRLFIDLFRFLTWFFFVEVFLHFVYVSAITFHPTWIKSFNSWSLYGYGYSMGHFFHLKYVILYGLSTSFSKFENIQGPSLPVCIGRVHLYSDMWRYFDAGLYRFLLRYIYIPLMRDYLKSRVLASLVCFIFVYVWHGIDYHILIWSAGNYFGILIEQFSKWIKDNCFQNSKVHLMIGPKWFRRMTCVAASPLIAMSAISNFYFFTNAEIGYIFVSRFLNDKLSSNVILLAILYTLCQVSTELRSRTKKPAKEKDI